LIVKFRTNKLERYYLEEKKAVRALGSDVARRFIMRINIIKAARSLEELKILPGLRCHALTGDRKGEYAININGFLSTYIFS